MAFAYYGKGRSGVVTTDCAPHWAPPEFCEWEYYNKLWQNIADWLIQK
ncbi:glutamine amidotransferase [Clostridium sp.]